MVDIELRLNPRTISSLQIHDLDLSGCQTLQNSPINRDPKVSGYRREAEDQNRAEIRMREDWKMPRY
jgi:hypothetical protein